MFELTISYWLQSFYYVFGPADLDEDYEDGFLPMRLRDISVLYTNSIYAIT